MHNVNNQLRLDSKLKNKIWMFFLPIFAAYSIKTDNENITIYGVSFSKQKHGNQLAFPACLAYIYRGKGNINSSNASDETFLDACFCHEFYLKFQLVNAINRRHNVNINRRQ